MSKYNCHVIIMLILQTFIIDLSLAQIYSFPEIKENLLRERPQIGDIILRTHSLESVDELILGEYPPLNPDAQNFYIDMLKKAMLEIQFEQVTSGATIWQLYNHGFIIKTPSICFGFDLDDYYYINEFKRLAKLLDVYFVSHAHQDHYDVPLYSAAVRGLGIPMVGPIEMGVIEPTIKLNAGDTTTISGLQIIAHDGLHSVPMRQFEVRTPEGLVFLHTGDNQTSLTLPDISDVDVLLLNAWINESGSASYMEGIRNAIAKLKPKVTLPGHILELGHLGGPHAPVTYKNVSDVYDEELNSEFIVLGWGERYHYDITSNDTIYPNIVQNVEATVKNDSILMSWDLPNVAEDGDTASFYRVLHVDYEDRLMVNRRYMCPIDTFSSFNFRIYSYDDCGNQSEDFVSLEITNISENYPSYGITATEFEIFQNFPNPFNTHTIIKYQLPVTNYVELDIYNLLGQKVAMLVSERQQAGYHQVEWDASGFASGIYYYRIEAGGFQDLRKMILIK